MYQPTLCMARKNLGNGINTQCSYRRKFDDYCGIHRKYRFRIDEPLPNNYKNNYKTLKTLSDKPKILKYKLNSISKQKLVESKQVGPKLVTLDDYLRGSHTKSLIKDLRYTLSYYNQPTTGKKQELINRLTYYFNTLVIYSPEINKIILLQRKIKEFIKLKHIKLRGPGFICRKKCSNDYDFFTCDDKMDIDSDYFISYKDNDNFIYCFDVRSLQKLIDTSNVEIPINPFSMKPLSLEVIKNNKQIIDDLKKKNIYQDFDEPYMTPEQKHKDKILRIFQEINELGNYTLPVWFSNLSLYRLRVLYNNLYEIWMMRADLTDEIRNRIVPTGPLFKLSISQVNTFKSKKKVQNIILDCIQRLISSAEQNSDKILGSLYVLTALSEVSKDCAQAHPWLLQG